jgi:hypothetical protein
MAFVGRLHRLRYPSPMTGKRYDNNIVGTAGRQLSKPFFNGRQGCLLVGEQRRLAAKRVGKQYMERSSVMACGANYKSVDFGRGVAVDSDE